MYSVIGENLERFGLLNNMFQNIYYLPIETMFQIVSLYLYDLKFSLIYTYE